MEFFSGLGIGLTVAGGVVSAFSARKPSRLMMWLTAYLVLIAGLAQLGFAYSWMQLTLPVSATAVIAFIVYNLGNVAVIVGRAAKEHSPYATYGVYTGGGLLAVSMLMMLWCARDAQLSSELVLFIALAIIILVSMPVGLVLTARAHKR